MRVLIIGPGYVGMTLAGQLTRSGHEVFALSRTADRVEALAAVGVRVLVGDITDANSLAALPTTFDWVVNCVSSTHGGVEDYQRVYLAGARNLIRWLAGSAVRKFVYTSSTGVYGQNDGSVVDETAVTEPPTETSRVLVATEREFLAAAREQNFPAVILRVAGIYGPGRGWWFKQFLAGEARLEGQGRRTLNMIHRDDVAGCVVAALERGQPGEIYNAVDDEPVTQRDFFLWLAAQAGQPMPSSVPEDPDAPRKRGVTDKRITNAKLKRELGYRFQFPTFREGYAAELRALGRG